MSVNKDGGLGARSSASMDLPGVLVAAVGAGVLVSGAVYSAAAIGRELGVPSNAVKRAMTELAAARVVEPLSSGGFRVGDPTVSELAELIDLRLSVEVPAIRQTAHVGLGDDELGQLYKLANQTMTAAANGDVVGYINADGAFHRRLLSATGNQQLVDVVHVLRSRSRLHGLHDADAGQFMSQCATEHHELVTLVGDGSVSAVGDLLAHHISHISSVWRAREN